MKEIQKGKEKKRAIQFLLGLHGTFLTIRGQILSMQEIPSLGKAYSLVMTEEKQKINVREKQSFMGSANYAKSTKKDKTNTPKEKGSYSKSGKKLNTNLFYDNCNFVAT